MAPSLLTPSQGYAVGSLLALALRQAQIHQTQPLGSFSVDDNGEVVIPDRSSSGSRSSCSSSASDGDDPQLWTHESHGLLRPVFSFFGIEKKAWPGIEETAASSPANHHVGALLRMIIEEGRELSHESRHQVLALRKAVDTMATSLEATSNSTATAREERREYENQCLKRSLSKEDIEGTSKNFNGLNLSNVKSNTRNNQLDEIRKDEALFGNTDDNYQIKVVVLFELLSACIADSSKETKHSHQRRGYDSRHRVALRLLSTWFDVPWNKFEAMEVMIACSAMAAVKDLKGIPDDSQANESKWSKWKRGGIIGAAALTGGTLLAITGGLAAPAIAAGFGALAPTLGTLVPVIGASGFAAAAGAAGSVAGSVAVAASFGAAGAGLTGTKVARRIGSIEEFEFMAIGKNHKQGCLAVGILISGFVFETEDFVRPWEHLECKLERYAIQWESQILIAVSTAIQDLITSSVATELMKQGAMMTVLSALVTALAWPAVLLSATSLIDGKWTMAVDRSDKAGKLLAEVLLKGLQGNRPVTLYGFSLGARVIFKCLQFLAESGDNEGLVERVVLLGAPISVDGEPWVSARKMVAGRFVNVYSSNDWFLGITFRASLLTQGLAGIQPVIIPGIENVDVTEYIDGHSSYMWATQRILEQLELDTYYPVFTAYSS